MTKFDEQYLSLCRRILEEGTYSENRTGVAAWRLPQQVLRFDLEEEFPILTSKHVAWRSAIIELLWIYQVQSNNVQWLRDRGVKIWNEWEIGADGYYLGKKFGKKWAGTIGTAYGWIVKKYGLTQNLIEKIKNTPEDRRMIISLWQDEWLKTAALPSCVWNNQWSVIDGRLNILVNVRSNDVPLGMPFNVTQYAVFCYLLAQVCGLKPGQMTYVINDAHIYENQIGGIWKQLRMAETCELPPAPKLWINPEIKDFFEFDNSKELKDIKVVDYKNLGRISMPVAV